MNLLREKHRLMPYGGYRIMENEAPDTSRADATAERLAGLSEEQLAWAKELWAETAPERAAASARAGAVSDAQLEGMRVATNQAQDYSNYERTTFRPLERQIVAEAQGFDSEANQSAAAGRATGDVRAAFDAQRDIAVRDATRMGFNPSDGNVMAAKATLDTGEALGVAAGANRAREQVKTIGRAMRQDAVNLGRNLASGQATQAGLAVTAGNSSANNAQLPIAATGAGAQIVNNGYAGAQGGLGTAGNIFTNTARARATDNSGAMGALGNVAGRLGAAWLTGGAARPI
jgi:hypothetical protein